MQMRTIFLILVLGIVAAGTVVGLALMEQSAFPDSGGEIKKFTSVDDLTSYLKAHRSEQGPAYPPVFRDSGVMLAAEGAGGGGASLMSMPAPSAAEYSSTNVQVLGVDEADLVKNDGKFIYLVSGSDLVIIDGYPPETAEIVSQTPIPDTPVELFLKGDRVVVFTTGYAELFTTVPSSVAPVPVSRQVTEAQVYDVSDRNNPVLEHTITITGSYYDSRMIGSYVYVIATEPVNFPRGEPVLPQVTEGGREVRSDIYYFDIPCPYYIYQTITSFSLGDGKATGTATYLVGPATTLYASRENLYIAYQRTLPPARWTEIQPAVADRVSPEYARDGTIIHRFSLDRGEVTYRATGDVPGRLLNQFSMDENNGNLRVATTVEGWSSRGSFQFNNVYVLDRSMDTVGRLEYIAPDERIYSTRFIGDRLYMVTFKRIDPFFVIDLSNPEKPGILGMLKIPGFSDYLHPYDENHIIGVGRETAENQWGGVSVAGLKIALFDVTDVTSPALIDRVEIGDAGSDSEALRDHKAFLFDKKRNLLVIPIEEVTRVPVYSGKDVPYTYGYWNGAYVFSVTPDQGFILKGKVTHGSGAERFSGSAPVLRSLYMDDVLSTISSRSVIMSRLDDPGTAITTISLPSPVYRWMYPVME
jgi:uncharacterized secreted protein with C-terminal beta-propeller domain